MKIISVSMSQQEKEQLEKLAAAFGISKSEMFRVILAYYIKNSRGLV